MKRGLLLFLILLVLPLSSGEILFSQVGQSYSFGDRIEAGLTVVADSAQTDFLTVFIRCGQSEMDFYRAPLTLAQGEQRFVDLSFLTTNALFNSLSGTCFFDASYAGQQRQSPSFLLTRVLIIEPVIEKTLYRPDEVVKISGVARTPNGRAASGYADVSFAGLSLSVPVRDGQFSLEIILPHAIAPSEHELFLRVYERDSAGFVSNEGNYTKNLTVVSVVDKVSVVPSSYELTPGELLVFTPYVFDQVGTKMSHDLSGRLYDPEGTLVFSRIFSSGIEHTYNVSLNATPGNWILEVETQSKEDSVSLHVLEYEAASFEIENSTLIVHNIGNVPYEETVQVSFNDVTVVRDVSIPVGGMRRLKLSAPPSTYTIAVRDSTNELVTSGIPLTGRAIDIGEYSSLGGVRLIFPALAIIVVLGLLFFGIRYYRARRLHYGDVEPSSRMQPMPRTVNLTSASFNQGEKEDAAIVSLSVARPSHNEGIGLIDDFKSTLTTMGGHVVDEGTALVGLFTPRVSGVDYLQKALRAGFECSTKAQDYNRLARYKVKVGAGVVDGQLITGYEGKKLSYASVQNSIGRSKNMAAASAGSQGVLLASESFYRKVASEVSAARAEKGWKILKIKDHAKHTTFVNTFLKRNDFKK